MSGASRGVYSGFTDAVTDAVPPVVPQSRGQLVAVSHERAHTPSPQRAQAALFRPE
ncbi:MAG TPA: hypothetical protein VGX24_07080 [Pyrinomonadaceae bacterium]|nr:hypothetical protein [Pyrinomonadaceae bacterium]